MSQVLYRKHRSLSLDEVLGQDHIVTALRGAIKSGRVAHAYLFTGPRGVGKTSVARILAHEINKLPYKGGENHLDIIEIDAASNRRIDEIRDLREKVRIAPTSAPYKVYIIDEVHMLTTEAFNALLKTLEEPPAHVIFILATTEAHKVPETILSRTQKFVFHPLESGLMVGRLAEIAKSESINTEEGALNLIAEHARGSFRDALSLLDQLRSQPDKITTETVEKVLGLPPHQAVTNLLNLFIEGNGLDLFNELEKLIMSGVNPASLAKGLSKLTRDRVVLSPALRDDMLPLIQGLIEVDSALDQRLQIEIALISAMPEKIESPTAESKAVVQAAEPELPAADEEPQLKSESEPVDQNVSLAETATESSADLDWNLLVDAARSRSEQLYALLRMAAASHRADTNTVVLKLRYAFHVKRLSSSPHQETILELLKSQLGNDVNLEIDHDNTLEESQKATLSGVADILDGEIVEL